MGDYINCGGYIKAITCPIIGFLSFYLAKVYSTIAIPGDGDGVIIVLVAGSNEVVGTKGDKIIFALRINSVSKYVHKPNV